MLQTKSLKELSDNREPIKWAVPGLLPVGITALCGKPKVGKTWLALDLCLYATTGRRFLGYETGDADALFISLDTNQKAILSAVNNLFENVIGDNPDNLFITTELSGGTTSVNELVEVIEAQMSEHPKLWLVVIDAIGNVKKTEGEVFPPTKLTQLAIRNNIAIIILVNDTKDNDALYADPVSFVYGKPAISPLLETLWILGEHEGKRTLKVIGSYLDKELTVE